MRRVVRRRGGRVGGGRRRQLRRRRSSRVRLLPRDFDLPPRRLQRRLRGAKPALHLHELGLRLHPRGLQVERTRGLGGGGGLPGASLRRRGSTLRDFRLFLGYVGAPRRVLRLPPRLARLLPRGGELALRVRRASKRLGSERLVPGCRLFVPGIRPGEPRRRGSRFDRSRGFRGERLGDPRGCHGRSLGPLQLLR